MHGEAYVAILFVGGLGSNSVRGKINSSNKRMGYVSSNPARNHEFARHFFYRYVSWIYLLICIRHYKAL